MSAFPAPPAQSQAYLTVAEILVGSSSRDIRLSAMTTL
jgi:hypothetical protein